MTSLSDRTEAELLADIASGDDAAFAVIYRRYLPIVLRWCLREIGNPELASDLAAEVFATALIVSHRYSAERGSVGAWLLGIAHKKLSESRRRGRVEDAARRRLRFDPIAVTDRDLERVDELVSLDATILELVSDLPEDQRAAIVSRVIDERPYSEIASELACSELVVRQRVSRGLRTMRARIEGP